MDKYEIEELLHNLMNILAALKVLSCLDHEQVETVYIAMLCDDYYHKLESIVNNLQKKLI